MKLSSDTDISSPAGEKPKTDRVGFGIKTFRWLDRYSNQLCLLALCGFSLYFLPLDVLRGVPASGGDTGSHYWPLHALWNFALPNLTYPVLNPGNNLGEPQLVHYFPTPFFVMVFLTPFVGSLGRAFNVGTILPVVVFPFCVYLFCYLSRFPRRSSLFATAFSLFALFNEAFSMWGGNTLSVLAGQFAHQYSLCFFLIAAGLFNRELADRREHYLSSIVFALTITSHAYIGLIIPFYVGFRCLVENELSLPERIRRSFIATALSFTLSAWSIVPMVMNNPWTTPLPMTWRFKDLMGELIPQILYPIIPIIGACCLFFLIDRTLKQKLSEISRPLLALVGISLVYTGLYFVFPKLGLVDVRVIPQVVLFLAMIAGSLLGLSTIVLKKQVELVFCVAVCVLTIYWTALHVDRFQRWSKWNYAGWYKKTVYPQLYPLYKDLKGDFSMPRVAWEHSTLNDKGGSLRLFEMIPYFTGRATLESLYTQSTVAAPAVYYLQSLISKSPSCPFKQYPCGKFNLAVAEDKLKLLGAGQLILAEAKSIGAAKKLPYLKFQKDYSPWQVFSLGDVSLVEVPTVKSRTLVDPIWKETFFDWFKNYSAGTPFIISLAKENEQALAEIQQANEKLIAEPISCAPSVQVNFNRIELTTPCPGRLHVLKFAFHPNWRSLSGERLFLTSPGFIGIIPDGTKVELKFGTSWIWKTANVVSIACLGWILFRLFRRKRIR